MHKIILVVIDNVEVIILNVNVNNSFCSCASMWFKLNYYFKNSFKKLGLFLKPKMTKITCMFKLQQTYFKVDVFHIPYGNNRNSQLITNPFSLSYDNICD
jgi:hypothetical protein